MRVALNSLSLSVQKPYVFAQKSQNNTIKQSSTVRELAGYNSVGRSMIKFKGDDETSNTATPDEKTVCINGEIYDFSDLKKKPAKELAALKEYCETKQVELNKKKELSLAKSEEINAWYDVWEYEKQKSDAENEIISKGLSRFWNPFQCKAIKEEYYRDFLDRREKIEELKKDGTASKEFIAYLSSQVKYYDETAKFLGELIEEKLDIEERLMK